MSSSWTFKPIIDGLAQSRTLLNIQKLRNLRFASFDPHIPILDFFYTPQFSWNHILHIYILHYIFHWITISGANLQAGTLRRTMAPSSARRCLCLGLALGAWSAWRCWIDGAGLMVQRWGRTHQVWRSYPLVNIEKAIEAMAHRNSWFTVLNSMVIFHSFL